MGYKTAQRTVARPLIARHGGTHQVDLAVDPDEAVAGMREDYSFNRGPDKVTRYSPNREGSPFDDYAYGAGSVEVTETATDPDGACETGILNDVQPEPGEADGEEQNAGGSLRAQARYNPTYRRRDGGIG